MKSSAAIDGQSVPAQLSNTGQLLVTDADLLEAKEIALRFSLDDTKRVRGTISNGL